MKKTVLREYARLIVRCGINVQKGQEVMIYADLDQPEFVKLVVEEAYKAKAKKVIVEWNYQPLEKIYQQRRDSYEKNCFKRICKADRPLRR